MLEPLPVACHTWWNYVCGTEVTLYATNPLTLTCAPCGPVVAPDNYVMVFGIGRHSAHAIHGASADLSNGSTERGLTSDGNPWAGLLRLRLDFDSGLRDAGIQYYRVSWRRAGGTFQPLMDECHRHYKVEPAPGDVAYVGYGLGPRLVGTTAALFEIPPALPPAGNWVVVDPVEDTTNAKFPSHLLVPASRPRAPRTTPASTSSRSSSSTAPATRPTRAGSSLGRPGRRRPRHLRHDPRRGAGRRRGRGGRVHPPAARRQQRVRGTDRRAGAQRLGGRGRVRRDALRARGRERGDAVPRGAPQRVRDALVLRQARRRSADHAAEREWRAGRRRELHRHSTVDALRGTCSIAAFAESLDVAATATDGWGRQSGLDAHDVRAFTLAPQP